MYNISLHFNPSLQQRSVLTYTCSYDFLFSRQALTYEDGGTALVESREICRHISERYAEQGNKALLGRGTLERAAIEQWLQAEQQTFDPPIASLVFHLAFAPQPSYAEKEVQKEEARLSKVLDSYDRTLDKSRFLAGEEFTLADLSHLPNSHYLVNMTEKAYLFRERKNVWRWWEEISSRPSWKKVVRIQEEPPAMPLASDYWGCSLVSILVVFSELLSVGSHSGLYLKSVYFHDSDALVVEPK
ncbi:Glutathione S-transferase F9 [Acorus gramineus]|uniref:glutathione transferase n=1 Tax=Acorus gramineus TaxID=55184 RepID=A0AAV9ACW2_ACOGR|nr:Glutathione S-transferase F9 [Acorus gramineus]